jgi:hypothetical protein
MSDTQGKAISSLDLLLLLFLFLFICVSLCMYVQEPEGTTWGRQISWSWRCKQIWATWCGCYEPNSGSLKKQQLPLKHLAFSQLLLLPCVYEAISVQEAREAGHCIMLKVMPRALCCHEDPKNRVKCFSYSRIRDNHWKAELTLCTGQWD